MGSYFSQSTIKIYNIKQDEIIKPPRWFFRNDRNM